MGEPDAQESTPRVPGEPAASAPDEATATAPGEPTPPVPGERAPEPRRCRLRFTGTGQEYFGIWIVNLLLTIVTLGIYSAWAKVRKLQYFYRNTQLDGSAFEYHGNPVPILKGRGAVAFAGDMRAGRLMGITLGNIVMVIFSLGLLIPFAVMRLMKYKIESIEVLDADALARFVGDETGAQVGTLGEGAVDVMDFDFGL